MYTYLEAWHSPLYFQASKAVSTLQRQSSFSATHGSPRAQVRARGPLCHHRSRDPPAALPRQLASSGPHLPLAPREPQRVGRAAGGSTPSPLALAPTLPVPPEATGRGRSPALKNFPLYGSVHTDPSPLSLSPPPADSTPTYGADRGAPATPSRAGRSGPTRLRSLCAGRHPPSNCGAQGRGVSGATGRSGRAGRAASGAVPWRPPPRPGVGVGQPPGRAIRSGVQMRQRFLLQNPEDAPRKALRKHLHYFSLNAVIAGSPVLSKSSRARRTKPT